MCSFQTYLSERWSRDLKAINSGSEKGNKVVQL